VKFRSRLPLLSLLCAFRCPANFSRENAGAHIKHAVIPLNPASGINCQHDDSGYREISRAIGRKIKFFNKTKLGMAKLYRSYFSRYHSIPPASTSADLQRCKKTKTRGSSREKFGKERTSRDPVTNKCEIDFFSLKVPLDSKKRSKSMRNNERGYYIQRGKKSPQFFSQNKNLFQNRVYLIEKGE